VLDGQAVTQDLRPPCPYEYPDCVLELRELSEPNHSKRAAALGTLERVLGSRILVGVGCILRRSTVDDLEQVDWGKHGLDIQMGEERGIRSLRWFGPGKRGFRLNNEGGRVGAGWGRHSGRSHCSRSAKLHQQLRHSIGREDQGRLDSLGFRMQRPVMAEVEDMRCRIRMAKGPVEERGRQNLSRGIKEEWGPFL